MSKKFEGSMVAIVTPFKNGVVDEAAFKKLLDRQIEAGTDVIVPCGTTGESATMSHTEHERVMTLAVEHISGRASVVCGAGSNNTAEASRLIQYAKKIGADGVLVVSPYYNKPTQEGLYRHYSELAKNDIPVVLYNVPGRTGSSIQPQTVARLAKNTNIVAIKEASGSLAQVEEILSLCDITVVSGDDGLTFPMMAIGARGVISVTANIAPKLVHEMVHLALDEKWDESREVHRKLYALSDILFIESNPIPVKTALGLMKLIEPEFRLPLCEMSAANEDKLKVVLQKMGLLNNVGVTS